MKPEENIIGEAPASATLSVVTPKGYNTLFTLREMSGKVLLEKITSLENTLEKLGYKPQVKQAFGQKKEVEYVEGKRCPLDGGRLILKKKADGSPFHKCENGKFNPTTKQSYGCTYVDWLNPDIKFDKKNPYSGGNSIPVDKYEEMVANPTQTPAKDEFIDWTL